MKPISASLKSVGLRQRAFFCFPPPQLRPASCPNAVRGVGHLNAVHKGARLRHRNLDKEHRTIDLVSGVSFSFDDAAMIPFVNLSRLEQSAVFSPVPTTRQVIALLAKYHCRFLRPYVSLEEARYDRKCAQRDRHSVFL
jgi:hypothetical protein